MWKKLYSGARHRRQYGACGLHVGYLRLQIHTQVVNVILIAFPLQQRLHEHGWMLHYMYIGCLVITRLGFVYCTVRAESVYINHLNASIQMSWYLFVTFKLWYSHHVLEQSTLSPGDRREETQFFRFSSPRLTVNIRIHIHSSICTASSGEWSPAIHRGGPSSNLGKSL